MWAPALKCIKTSIERMAVLFPRRLRLKLLLLLVVAVVCFLISVVFLHRELYSSQSPAEIHLREFPGDDDSDENSDKRRDHEDEDFLQHLERSWKEPEWKVAEILRLLPAMKKPVLPVFVVEEHHEVLKYWFDGAETGVIPKSGNTLFHIDGHADSAPPRDPWSVPWFRLPRNHSEVANMMQSNDVFIAGAALTGLINRYIWVWPDWDRAEHKEERDHEIMDVKAGWRTYYPEKGKPFRRLCVCEKQRTRPQGEEGEPEWSCWDDKPEESMLTGGGPMVQSLQCKAEFTGVMEHVHESKAVELLQRGDWIRKDEKLMLDIDEDYYGCESSVMPLINSGMTLPEINKLSALIGKLLCVNEVRYELIADKFFQVVLRIVEDFRSSVCNTKSSKSRQKCLSDFEADQALIQLIPTIYGSLEQADIEGQVCDAGAAEVMLQVIMRSLYKLKQSQINALKYVGACLTTAPTSFIFQPESLHVCHGFNVPGDMSVSVHVPTAEENKIRTKILKKTLTLLPTRPSVVTICRSMRDGYTPWAFFDSIEKDVVDTLKSVYPDVTENSFHFDENLLGGKKGWPSRNKN